MIYVSPLSAVQDAITAHGPSHLVSLLDPKSMIETPGAIGSGRHLKLGINDISEPDPDLVTPADEHIEELVGFVSAWPREAPMLIHCWAGVSRSTTAAFITLCVHNEPGDEHKFAARLRGQAAHAYPNRLMVALADDILGRSGRMVDAIDGMSAAQLTLEGKTFSLSVNG